MESVWVEHNERVRFEPLKENRRTDVLIIGGGIAGILCAYRLKAAGVDCLLVEAGRIGGGITKDTTAKIMASHGLLYDRLIRQIGEEKAGMYLQAQLHACREYEQLCAQIPCEYEKKDAYVYSTADRRRLERELSAYDRLGARASLTETPGLPHRTVGALRLPGQAQFHPLHFLLGLAKGLPIYENTRVLQIKPHSAVTQYGEIHCEKMVVATHFPILNKHGGYSFKLYQHRSYVLALEGCGDMDGMYVDEAQDGLSFRSYSNLLLLGGGAHRTGKRGGGWHELEAFARTHYPQARVTHRWATQDCMTLDGIPYVGQYARSTPNLYVATGFNKWGMTSAMVSSLVLTERLCGRDCAYAEVLSPSRSMLRPQLAVNIVESVTNALTPTAPRCSHLGCALKYNRQEHSWDCPCHGSRFTESGDVIDNPSTKNISNNSSI